MNMLSFGTIDTRTFKASLLLPLLAFSLIAGTFAVTQVQSSVVPVGLNKISPTLLGDIVTKGSAPVDILVKTSTADYATIIGQITELGGTVRFQYKHVNALAATMEAGEILQLVASSNVEKVSLDQVRALPEMSHPPVQDGTMDSVLNGPAFLDGLTYNTVTLGREQLSQLRPETYWNYKAMGAFDAWNLTNYGYGSTAAIIDTGIFASHFMIAGSVIGGVDMSTDQGTPYEGFDRVTNHWHGSHVAGIFAGHGAILVPPTSLLAQSIELYTGETLGTFDGNKVIPLLGMAPLASIYVIKVFPHTGAGASESVIIAAIEHAIDMAPALDIDLISMSLGGATLFDGRDLEDMTVDAATAAGIVVSSAAGNEGPASMTLSSPGSADTGMAVAAAANPVNTRVFWDQNYGQLGIGYQLFTRSTPQIYAFSSRGPTSDGRGKPDVAATGLLVLSAFPCVPPACTGQPTPNGLAFASGTSMATPAVSGAVALLNAYAEMNSLPVTPTDIKQAIKGGANLLPGYDARDQGSGYLNAYNSLQFLIADTYGSTPTPLPPTGTLFNLDNTGLVGSGTYSASTSPLAPGHKVEYVFTITQPTDKVTVQISGVSLGASNPLGLNSLEVYIQSAKRTTYAYYIESANVIGDATFTITDDATTWTGSFLAGTDVFFDEFTRPLEPGFMKLVVENDWTSFDNASASVQVTLTTGVKTPNLVISGSVADGMLSQWYTVSIPARPNQVVFELWWANDWTVYPTSDLDMYIDKVPMFTGETIVSGATINAPERVVVMPAPSTLYVLVHGFAIHTGSPENFEIRVFW